MKSKAYGDALNQPLRSVAEGAYLLSIRQSVNMDTTKITFADSDGTLLTQGYTQYASNRASTSGKVSDEDRVWKGEKVRAIRSVVNEKIIVFRVKCGWSSRQQTSQYQVQTQ